MTETAMVAGMQQQIPFDPYAYDFHEDPYPTYARLREQAPVYTTRIWTSGRSPVTTMCETRSATV